MHNVWSKKEVISMFIEDKGIPKAKEFKPLHQSTSMKPQPKVILKPTAEILETKPKDKSIKPTLPDRKNWYIQLNRERAEMKRRQAIMLKL